MLSMSKSKAGCSLLLNKPISIVQETLARNLSICISSFFKKPSLSSGRRSQDWILNQAHPPFSYQAAVASGSLFVQFVQFGKVLSERIECDERVILTINAHHINDGNVLR
mmetsp:Transcript_40573/g.64901  ORF Transcript_40573/g.64901 Transcript_40573/m.64901 type:complete len:110 (+) Transcript_40573:419-748(+)